LGFSVFPLRQKTSSSAHIWSSEQLEATGNLTKRLGKIEVFILCEKFLTLADEYDLKIVGDGVFLRGRPKSLSTFIDKRIFMKFAEGDQGFGGDELGVGCNVQKLHVQHGSLRVGTRKRSPSNR